MYSDYFLQNVTPSLFGGCSNRTSGLFHTSAKGFSLQFPGIDVLRLFLNHCVRQALWETLLPVFHITIALESVY